MDTNTKLNATEMQNCDTSTKSHITEIRNSDTNKKLHATEIQICSTNAKLHTTQRIPKTLRQNCCKNIQIHAWIKSQNKKMFGGFCQ